MPENRPNVGGQAVLEGVMMRSPKCFAVAVRRKGGQIVVREQPWEAAWTSRVAKVPFVRGAVTLFESMHNGYSALRFSAEQMEIDLLEEERREKAEARVAAAEAEAEARAAQAEADAAALGAPPPAVSAAAPAASVPSATVASSGPTRAEKIEAEIAAAATTADAPGAGASGAGTRLATLFAIGLFIALPHLITKLIGGVVGPGLDPQHFAFHAVTGGFKLLLVLGYLMLIRRVPEVRRVFQYHGAEHKAIATFEAHEPLTVEYAKRHSTRHARCGTTFLIVVIMVSVLVYAAVLPPILRALPLSGGFAEFFASMAIKILALPLIAGFAYELQRLGARFVNNPLARVFLTPGYWVQGITTIEPSDDQLEIALASLRITLAREAQQARGEAAAAATPVVQTFPSFSAFADAYGGATGLGDAAT